MTGKIQKHSWYLIKQSNVFDTISNAKKKLKMSTLKKKGYRVYEVNNGALLIHGTVIAKGQK